MTASTDDSQPPGLTNASLDALHNFEQASLMNLVDKLRRNGASAHLQLPQIVVCGAQSSGKSSTLEALTGIPFPRKENLCTRFATEISMRRDQARSISCQINPDESRTEEKKTQLRDFSRTITDFSELPDVIEEATKTMELSDGTAFSKDALSIVICGPDSPQFAWTVVDLPGLIHASNRSQTEADVELIRNLVMRYIKAERTIILAVVSAKNDYANQIILKMSREVDPSGSRTLGVVTKPDFLRVNSDNEKSWLVLCRNQDIKLDLGWHVLKNLSDEEHGLSTSQRDSKEQAFLDGGNWASIAPESKGIAALRVRLSQLLTEHLRREMPKLRDELQTMSDRSDHEVADLGPPLATLVEQKIYLSEFLYNASEIVDRAARGSYDGPFFEIFGLDLDPGNRTCTRRLRAVVQNSNFEFADKVRLRGRKYDIEGLQDDNSPLLAPIEHKKPNAGPGGEAHGGASQQAQPVTKMTQSSAIAWVVKMIRQNRGFELPGMFNPLIVSQIFWQLSEPWEQLAQNHINQVIVNCGAFFQGVINHCASIRIREKIMEQLVRPALAESTKRATNELKSIIEDKGRHPITYNHYFTDTLQKIGQSRYQDQVLKLTKDLGVSGVLHDSKNKPIGPSAKYVDVARFETGLQNVIQQNMDKFAAQQALDGANAFYTDERKYFVDAIAKQVIERHISGRLLEVLSTRTMAHLSDNEIQSLVGEPAHTTALRERLESKKIMLQDSQQAFALAMSGQAGGKGA